MNPGDLVKVVDPSVHPAWASKPGRVVRVNKRTVEVEIEGFVVVFDRGRFKLEKVESHENQ